MTNTPKITDFPERDKQSSPPTLEDVLLQSEQRFQATFEQVAVGMAHVGLDGQWLQVNQKLCDIVGYKREDLLALTFQAITYHEDLEKDLNFVQRLLAGDIDTYTLQKRYIRSDGSLVWTNLTVSLVRNVTGTPRYFIAVIEDISERRELKDQLQKALSQATTRTRQLEAMFEAMNEAVFIFDSDGNVQWANPAMRDLLSLDKDPSYFTKALNERVRRYELRNEQGELLAEEQWPVSRVLRGEVFTTNQVSEIWLRTLDGRERFINCSGAPIRDEQGEIIGGLLVLHDITEHHQMERRTQEALGTLLEMAEVLVQVTDTKQSSKVNTATALTEAAERLVTLTCQLLGTHKASIAAVDPREETLTLIATVGVSEQDANKFRTAGARLSDYFDPPTISRIKRGEVMMVDIAAPDSPNIPTYGIQTILAVPLCIREQFIGLLALDYSTIEHIFPVKEEMALAQAIGRLTALVIERERLVTERAAAQSEALAQQKANRQLDTFLSIASHELRTPLTTIKANVQLAGRQLRRLKMQEPLDSEKVKATIQAVHDMLERVERQVAAQNRLITDLLDVSRIQSGKLELRLINSDLVKVVREVVNDHRQTMAPRVIILEEECERAAVVVDADRIVQVITNYLTNAVKFSKEDRAVTVRITYEGGQVRVAVKDEGPGLNADEQQRVWERFQQIPSVPVQQGAKGLGLGLYICKSIIEQHHGDVGVESQPGVGSTFWFTLPLVD